MRRCFPGDLLPLLTKLISETKCAGLPPHNGAIAKCVIVCVQRRRGNVSKGFWQGWLWADLRREQKILRVGWASEQNAKV